MLAMSLKSSGSGFTEDWLPVKSITNGMIELNNNIKVTGSFGVSASSASTVKPADLIKNAEKA